MIDPQTVARVKQLLVAGELSQRGIARLTGISRGTVGNIFSGKRRDYPPKDDLSSSDVDQSKPAERCAACGGKVYMPCRLCRARKAMAKGRRQFARSEDPDETDNSHQLRGSERERYEEIHRQKEATGEDQSDDWQEPRENEDDAEALDELEAA